MVIFRKADPSAAHAELLVGRAPVLVQISEVGFADARHWLAAAEARA